MQNTFWADRDMFEPDSPMTVKCLLYRNYTYIPHRHEFYEMNIVVGGEGIHTIQSRALRAEKGDVFVIPSGITHSYLSGNSLDVYHILLKNSFFERYAADLSTMRGFKTLFDMEPLLRRTGDGNIFLKLSGEELYDVKAELLKAEVAEKNGDYTAQQITVLNLLCSLSGKMENQNTAAPQDEMIVNIMKYIEEHLDDDLTLDALCAFSYMSKSTLNRLFRRKLRQTPRAYIISCRVKKARALLARGNGKKSDIAQRCGFYDISHMEKCLSKEM